MIAIHDLDFRYRQGGFRLRIPELVIGDGAKAAVIGPSGSGKTTFLNLVSGISVARGGRVVVGDHEVSALNDAARRDFRIANVGFVFQDFELVEYLNVLDNILHPYRINRSLCLTTDVRDRARQLAAEMGLADKLRRLPERLSQGERQRAAICRALITEPTIILADEPTGNLDPAGKGRILSLLIDYAGQRNATLIMVTHDHSLLDGFGQVIDFESYHVGGGNDG
jgi:ABC-type lipoprotein export system ATPase subunit